VLGQAVGCLPPGVGHRYATAGAATR
jgi:hypothetical protein